MISIDKSVPDIFSEFYQSGNVVGLNEINYIKNMQIV